MNREHICRYLREIRKSVRMDFVSFAQVVKDEAHLLNWICASGNLNQKYRQIVLEAGQGIAGTVYQDKRVLLVNSVDRELSGRLLVNTPIILAEHLQSFIALPLWKEDCVEGILLLGMRSEDAFSKERYMQIMHYLGSSFHEYKICSESYEEACSNPVSDMHYTIPIYELTKYPVLKAREEERHRIARDLHDSTIQNILGVQMLLRSLKYKDNKEEWQEILTQVDSWLNNIQNELRGISNGLRPSSLDDLGLHAALCNHFRLLEESHRVKVDFSQNIGNQRYNKDVEDVFYRICQEATVNACKYAGVGNIWVSLYKKGKMLCLEVVDRGAGVDPQKPIIRGGGLGLESMRDWARTIDGELMIQSVKDGGTRVALFAALPEDEEEEG